MAKIGKRLKTAYGEIDRQARYPLGEAIELATKLGTCKFDETVEIAVRLGVDPRQADQNVRGTVALPHGTGRSVRVLVFAKGEKEREASEAGADVVGGEELVKKIADEGWLEFDKAVATPDMMGKVGRLGRVLGPRGLMPNPKTGTVVPAADLPRAIREAKAGRVEFRVDKTGNLHVPIGKVSFSEGQLRDNMAALMAAVIKAKPASAKGTYLKKVVVAATMGPGVRVDPNALIGEAA